MNLYFIGDDDYDNIMPTLHREVDDGKVIEIDGTLWKERVNSIIHISSDIKAREIKSHRWSVQLERKYFLAKAKRAAKMVLRDLHSRRACFAYIRNWRVLYTHCISLMHFYIRDKQANVNIYIRSWDIEYFLMYDVDTILKARDMFAAKSHQPPGDIYIWVMSLHKEISKCITTIGELCETT